MKVKRDDTVQVVAGANKGNKGRVIRIDSEMERIVIENVNKRYRHVKPSQENPKGGRVQVECPIPASNVMVVCKKCDKPVRIGYQITADKEKVRVCRTCKEAIA